MAKNTELPEGQFFTVADAIGRVNRASRHLDQTLGNLQNCRLHVDADSFKHAQFYLDKIHADLASKVTAHINAGA